MIAIIGSCLLILLSIIASVIIIYNFFQYKLIKKHCFKSRLLAKFYKKNHQINFYLITALVANAIFCQLTLIFAYVVSDYSIENVYLNSHHLKPLIYKIAGSWGNHEGSMLLLIAIISLYSLAFSYFAKIRYDIKMIVNSVQAFLILSFSSFTLFTSSPFLYNKLYFVENIATYLMEGQGLNPLLQDIGLAMHPPMLYIGYVGFSIIFSLAIAILITQKFDKKIAKVFRQWLFFTLSFLTLGITLGSWWAYRELGWGGYWFWDPVENISLMPWLIALAIVHSSKFTKQGAMMINWNLFLALLCFILCLIGIFLTRSGLLSSVHSFAVDAERGFFILLMIGFIGLLAFLIFAFFAPKIVKKYQLLENTEKYGILSKYNLVIINNYFLIIALFVVFLGTIYPLISQNLLNQSIAIGAEYYNNIFSIMMVPFLVFSAISHLSIDNKALNFFSKKQKNIVLGFAITASAIFITLTSYLLIKQNIVFSWLMIIILFLGLILLILGVFEIIKTLTIAKNYYYLKFLTSAIAHSGFALIIIGIVISSMLGITKEINIKERDNFTLGNFKINFVATDYKAQDNFISRLGIFEIRLFEKKLTTLTPELRYYPVSQQVTNESAIYRYWLGDIYLVIGQKDEKNYYAVRAYYKPMIRLIWAGSAMIFLSLMINLFFGIKKIKSKQIKSS